MKPLPVVVDSRIRIPLGLLSGRDGENARLELQVEFTHDNPDHDRESRLAKARGYERKGFTVPKSIETWTEEDGTLTLPRGRFARVREILQSTGFDVQVQDMRSEGDPKLRHAGYALRSHIDPAQFQIDACAIVIEKQNCIFRSGTGSGKTCIAEMIAGKLGLPTLVLVQTNELFNQWKRRLHSELGVQESEIGEIKGPKHKIKPITIGSVQTVAKHVAKYKKTFGVVIFDEVQRAAANTFYPAVDGLDAKYRIGISADERRKDKKDFLIYDLFGKVALEVDRQRLIDDHFILDTEVRLVETSFNAPWYAKLSNTQKQENQVFKRLLDGMTADEDRNVLVAQLAVEQMKAGHVSLVFSHRVEHCFDLRSRIVAHDPRAGIVVGEPKYKRESSETLADIASGKIVTAIGTVQSIGTGIDLPAADRGIATTPMHSNNQQAKQMRGRLCRVDRSSNARKVDSILYVLWDRKIHGLVPLRKWLQINKGNVTIYNPTTGCTEPGRAYLKRAERQDQEIF
jgi:superfamily II DNA or RNA helicase